MARAAMQEKAEISIFMLCKLEENSTMASTHSPNPRTHCSLCNTTPLQKISFPSTGLDLQLKNKTPLIKLGNKWGFKSLLIIGQLIKPKAMKLEGGIADYLKPWLFYLAITQPHLYASRKTKSSRKADSKRRSWSCFGRSEKPGIFSAQPRMISMEPVRRS